MHTAAAVAIIAAQGLAPVPRDTDKAELLRTLRVHATRRVAQHARAAATALEEGGCDGMVRFIAALAGYGEAGALGARDRDEATIACETSVSDARGHGVLWAVP